MKFYVGHIVYRDQTRSAPLTLFEENFDLAWRRCALLAIKKGGVGADVEERPLSEAALFGRDPDEQTPEIVEHIPRHH